MEIPPSWLLSIILYKYIRKPTLNYNSLEIVTQHACVIKWRSGLLHPFELYTQFFSKPTFISFLA